MGRTIELPDKLARSLEEVAAREGRPVAAVVNDALEAFVAREARGTRWQEDFQAAVDAIRANVPAGIDPDTIDRDVDEAVREVRAQRARRR